MPHPCRSRYARRDPPRRPLSCERTPRLAHLGSRPRGLGRRAGQRRRAVDSRRGSAGSTSPRRWPRTSTACGALARAASRRSASTRSTCSAWAAAACAPKSCATSAASRQGYPELYVLDTTDEQTITTRRGALDPARTLFLVASKSGGTVEVASLERFFWSRMHGGAGQRRRAGTSSRSPIPARRSQTAGANRKRLPRGVRQPGRHRRALFGAVAVRPRARGADRRAARRAPRGGAAMADGCRQENHANRRPRARRVHRRGGARGPRQADGRAAAVARVARPLDRAARRREHRASTARACCRSSTSRSGRPDEYGNDRAFVAIADRSRRAGRRARSAALEAAGHPVLRLTTRIDGLGAEFFRWEFATAVAGAALGINPFDEPNVSEAKEKTKALLGALRVERPAARRHARRLG